MSDQAAEIRKSKDEKSSILEEAQTLSKHAAPRTHRASIPNADLLGAGPAGATSTSTRGLTNNSNSPDDRLRASDD